MLLMSYQCIENKLCGDRIGTFGSVGPLDAVVTRVHQNRSAPGILFSCHILTSEFVWLGSMFLSQTGNAFMARSNTIHPNALQQSVTALACSQGARILINLSCIQSNYCPLNILQPPCANKYFLLNARADVVPLPLHPRSPSMNCFTRPKEPDLVQLHARSLHLMSSVRTRASLAPLHQRK